jgi:small-conductance mechanosensitive channel
MKPASHSFGRLGVRGRISAGTSLIISIIIIGILFLDVGRFVWILQEAIFLISDFSGITFLLLTVIIYTSMIGLFIAAFTHVLADLEDLAHPRSLHSVTALRMSGMVLLLATAVLSPFLFCTSNIRLLGIHPIFVTLHLVLVPVLIQTAVAAEKNTLAEQNKEASDSSDEKAKHKPPVPEASTTE